MSPAPARSAALRVLGEVRRREAYGPAVLEGELAAGKLTDADRALTTRLVYGTLQSEGTLDEALDRHLRRPRAVEPRVRDALRLAAYELLFMRTPPRAAVNEAVDAVRRARPQAAGMANAVLRRLAEEAPSFPWGDPDNDVDALARATAHPPWMVAMLLDELGEAAARRMLAADSEPAPLYLAHNPFRGEMEALLAMLAEDGAEPERWGPPGCVLARRAAPALSSRAVSDGLAVVMDAAAQVAPVALDPRPGQTVVDVASGRGGKTMLLQARASASGGRADIFAVDVHPFKARILAERMSFLGVPGVTPLVGDAEDPASIAGLPRPGTADAVLLDAPCSNLGTLRRHPEKRWRLRPDDIGRLSGLQSRLLAAAASLVRPGGVVVYSTCSVSRRENADVVAGLLADGSGEFQVRSLGGVLPEDLRDLVADDGTFQSVPEPGGPDGHFVAALQRCG